MSLSAQIHLTRKEERNQKFELRAEFKIPDDGITAIFGPSGSGKTSLLRCIAGLEKQVTGQILFKSEVWQALDSFLPPYKRRVGYVFQSQNLFPHLTSQQNVDFAVQRRTSVEHQLNPESIYEALDISSLLDKMPHQLSGGEQQLVAIARAVLSNPSLILMDEPLSSLDEQRKKKSISTIKNINEVFGIPIIYVTHSINEVLEIADHIMVIDNGKLVISKPLMEALTELPESGAVWPDLGAVIEGIVTSRDQNYGLSEVEFQGGHLRVANDVLEIGSKVRLSILARDISLARTKQEDSSILNKVQADIIEILEDNNPAFRRIHLSTKKTQFKA
jgi:molybdate transport system ATP-binding protein